VTAGEFYVHKVMSVLRIAGACDQSLVWYVMNRFTTDRSSMLSISGLCILAASLFPFCGRSRAREKRRNGYSA